MNSGSVSVSGRLTWLYVTLALPHFLHLMFEESVPPEKVMRDLSSASRRISSICRRTSSDANSCEPSRTEYLLCMYGYIHSSFHYNFASKRLLSSHKRLLMNSELLIVVCSKRVMKKIEEYRRGERTSGFMAARRSGSRAPTSTWYRRCGLRTSFRLITRLMTRERYLKSKPGAVGECEALTKL